MSSHNNVKFGIVQGRLVKAPPGCLQWFPQKSWESEFYLASALGYDYIELIAEREQNDNNPLWSEQGVKRIKDLTVENGLSLHAFCTDYIIDHSLSDDACVFDHTVKLLSRGKSLGVQKLILPMFEKSEVNERNSDKYLDVIKELASVANRSNISLCLETILNGKELLNFLRTLDSNNVGCVFDTGNRVAFGHNIYSDIKLLGDKIYHVHIKDKNEDNENVLLGTGKVNFYKAFESLAAIGYKGPYTFETFRGINPVNTARYNKMLAEFFINEHTDTI